MKSTTIARFLGLGKLFTFCHCIARYPNTKIAFPPQLQRTAQDNIAKTNGPLNIRELIGSIQYSTILIKAIRNGILLTKNCKSWHVTLWKILAYRICYHIYNMGTNVYQVRHSFANNFIIKFITIACFVQLNQLIVHLKRSSFCGKEFDLESSILVSKAFLTPWN